MELKDAICDLRYLLNRGYKRKTALRMVEDRYQLSSGKRNFLVRAVFSEEEAREHKIKLACIEDVDGKLVAIDGYNILIGVEAALKGESVFLCDDGFVRDASAIFGKYRVSKYTLPAVEQILEVLKVHSPKEAIFIFDAQISRSGELAALVRGKLQEFKLIGDAIAVPNADYELSKYQLVCSSDRAIIKKVQKVVDLTRCVVKDIEKLPECREEK
ncbi:MAG: DUF434 domain-containing protein [Candidatus Hydrothermarchaeales archaeon]